MCCRRRWKGFRDEITFELSLNEVEGFARSTDKEKTFGVLGTAGAKKRTRERGIREL